MRTREIIIVIILLSIALIRFLYFIPTPSSGYFDNVGKIVEFSGQVIDTPDTRINNQRIIIKPKNSETNILVIASNDIDINYGDDVLVKGKLETPENFFTNTGKEFNYQKYLANKDIYFIVQYSDINIISHNNGNYIKKYLFNLKEIFVKNINLVIDHPSSDLANGLILGVRGSFTEKIRNDFITTGTIHIVALSGYNVSIVATSVMRLFNLFLSKSVSAFFGIFTIILFVIMSGSGASAVRAGIMACIALLGRIHGREYDAGRALVVAGLAMFAYEPRVITDISFQLSFVATFGILYVTPKVIGWVWWIPARFGLREIAATTIAAQIAVLPLLLYSSGVLSFVSFPANILILPFIPMTMLLSFLSGLAGFFSLEVSGFLGSISEIILSYILGVINLFSSFDFSSVTVYKFPLFLVFLTYCILFLWVFRKEK